MVCKELKMIQIIMMSLGSILGGEFVAALYIAPSAVLYSVINNSISNSARGIHILTLEG